MPNLSSGSSSTTTAPGDSPLDLDPLPELRVIDLEPEVEYIISYKDQRNDLTLIRYSSGQCRILGISPAALKRFDKDFKPDQPFRFL